MTEKGTFYFIGWIQVTANEFVLSFVSSPNSSSPLFQTGLNLILKTNF